MISKEVVLQSAGAFGAMGIMVWLQIRAYGIVCVLALSFWIYKTRYPNIKVSMPQNVSEKWQGICGSFIKLRNEKPSAFCTIISLTLVILAIFGHIISGKWILLSLLLVVGLVSTKHKFQVVNEKSDDTNYPNSQQSSINDHDVDEFLPEVNESNLFVLHRAGEEAVITYNVSSLDDNDDDDNKSESEIPSDLVISEELLPEVDENSLSSQSDHEDFDDGDIIHAISEGGRTTDNIALNEIKFNTKYFKNGDTSSSDDDSITRGLSFLDLSKSDIDGKRAAMSHMSQSCDAQRTRLAASSALPNISGLVNWGVNNLLRTAVEQEIIKMVDSKIASVSRNYNSESSDDEFEFINPDDLNS